MLVDQKQQQEQRAISSESPVYVTEGWPFQASLHIWTNVTTSTMNRKLCEAGLYGRITVKKPLLWKQNNVKKLQLTKVLKDWKIEQWNKVLWTDESKFKIFESNRRVYVRWNVGERVATICTLPTAKHGGGFVMVCGGVSPIAKLGICTSWKAIWIRPATQHTATSCDPIWNVVCGSRIYIHTR